MPRKKHRVLVIGDTHLPCMVDGYVDFLRDTYKSWQCDKVVHIGDYVDNVALSFHLKPPHLKDPHREYQLALAQGKALWKAFPSCELLLGNHDVLPYRWAEQVGIPDTMLRKFGEIFELPRTWRVHSRYHQLSIDGVIFQHGDRGKGGSRLAAAANARAEFTSVVQGHYHAQAGVEFIANLRSRVFGMQVGCGIDYKHAQMEYGVKFTNKPIVGCGVVIEGQTPIFEPMLL